MYAYEFYILIRTDTLYNEYRCRNTATFNCVNERIPFSVMSLISIMASKTWNSVRHISQIQMLWICNVLWQVSAITTLLETHWTPHFAMHCWSTITTIVSVRQGFWFLYPWFTHAHFGMNTNDAIHVCQREIAICNFRVIFFLNRNSNNKCTNVS